MVVAQGRAVARLAAGDEPVPPVGVAPQIHADVIDLGPVACVGVEEDEVADLEARKPVGRVAAAHNEDARRAVVDLMGAARNLLRSRVDATPSGTRSSKPAPGRWWR